MKKFHRGAVAMLSEKLIKMVSHLVMLILLARFLGTEELGQLMYCLALASIFIFLNGLGLDTLLTKQFIDRPSKKHSYLQHALIARLIAGVICIILINIVAIWLVDESYRLLLFIISLYHLLMPFTVFDWYLQAEGKGELSAIALIFGHITGFIFRLICLYLGGDILWLGFAYFLEALVLAGSLFLIVRRQNSRFSGPISPERIKNMVTTASPLIVSGAVVLLYMKVDQLMLGYMINESEVAVYVAATRLSEAWYFVGLTLIGVYFPLLLQILNEKGIASYRLTIINMGSWLIWGAISLAMATVFLADWLIYVLYGTDFHLSADVLIVTIWAVPFVYLGAISTKMFVTMNKQKIVLYRSVSGLIVNLALNILLIPYYGALGAALATLVAQIFASYIVNAFVDKNGDIFKTQTMILFRLFIRSKYLNDRLNSKR